MARCRTIATTATTQNIRLTTRTGIRSFFEAFAAQAVYVSYALMDTVLGSVR